MSLYEALNDSELFYTTIDGILDEPVDLTTSNQELRIALRRIPGSLYNDLRAAAYGLFARQRSYIKEGSAIPYPELHEQQQKDWHDYQRSAELRDHAKTIVLKVLQDFSMPPVNPQHPHLYALKNAEHRIVSYLLPDITDEEARQLFDEHYNAVMVHQEITPENAKFYLPRREASLQELEAYKASLEN